MTMAFRSPRTIAEQKNEGGNFDRSVEGYNAEDGVPTGPDPCGCLSKRGKGQDYAANPSNPAEPAAPARNLKR